MKITDADYWCLSHKVYKNKYLKKGSKYLTIDEVKNPTEELKDHKWRVISSIDKDKSGLQAAMVVPANEYKGVISGKKEPSHAIFVSRGTEDGKDWLTNMTDLATYPKTDELKKRDKDKKFQRAKKDAEYLSKHSNFSTQILSDYNKGRMSTENNQFAEYEKFVAKNIKKYQPKDFSFTGHSLGGALATKEAVKYNKKATVFAAANPYRLLSEDEQRDVKAGKYEALIKNFRHHGDIVPEVPFGEDIGMQVFAESAVHGIKQIPFFTQHVSKSWTGMFNSNGSVKIEASPDKLRGIASDIYEMSQELFSLRRQLESIFDEADEQVLALKRKYENEVGYGEFDELTIEDVEDKMDEIFQRSSQGYSVYDEETYEEFMFELRDMEDMLEDLAKDYLAAAERFEEGDLTAALMFE